VARMTRMVEDLPRTARPGRYRAPKVIDRILASNHGNPIPHFRLSCDSETAAVLYLFHPSPIGDLLLAGDGAALSLIGFPAGKGHHKPGAGWTEDGAAFSSARRQLDAYFDGTLREFNLPLTPRGTGFQLAVWEALTHIPYGQTIAYRDLAIRIGNPAAVRAAGAANGANPLPIVIPCHRVIGADGSLTGFGGGIETKRWLLRHEGAAGHTERAEQGALPFATEQP